MKKADYNKVKVYTESETEGSYAKLHLATTTFAHGVFNETVLYVDERTGIAVFDVEKYEAWLAEVSGNVEIHSI